MKGVSIWEPTGPAGAMTIAADHPRLDPDLADRVVEYLTQGHVLVRISDWGDDVLAPGQGLVGRSILTDGEWVWDESLIYYVARHRLSPGQEFLDYLTRRDFVPRVPTASELEAVREILRRSTPGYAGA